MDWDEFEKKVQALIPTADIEFDNNGQLIIYTGLTLDDDDNIKEF